MRIAILALGAVLLQGCAVMTAEECVHADWHTVGFEDGSAGKPLTALGPRREACAKHAVRPDLDAYRAGHSTGIAGYCVPGRGFSEGARGMRYAGVCPATLEGPFLEAFRAGEQLHGLEDALSEAQRALHHEEHALDRLDDKIAEQEKRLVADGLKSDQRAKILLDLKDLSRKRDRHIASIVHLTHALDARAAELADYRRSLAPEYTAVSY
jgi:hypothetical protein